VLLGAYPLRKEYGGVLQYIRAEYTSFMASRPNTGQFRARLNHPPARKVRLRDESGNSAERRKSEGQDLDGLTQNDRSQLNNLIESLNP